MAPRGRTGALGAHRTAGSDGCGGILADGSGPAGALTVTATISPMPRPEPPDFDRVLAAARPDLDGAVVVDAVAEAFGLRTAIARDLGSERDRTFALEDGAGRTVAVAKVSNVAEDPAILDMEALAVLHAVRVDPGLPLAIPRARLGAAAGGDDPVDRRVPLPGPHGVHHLRLYDLLQGRQRSDPRGLDDAALAGWGATAARLDLALRGFFHPAAGRTMLWDVQHAARTRTMVPAIADPHQRGLVERVLDRYDQVVAPAWPSLRAQVVHGDLTTDNALTDDAGRITGIVDFGDMSHSALLIELAAVLDSVLNDREGDELLRAARLVVDGYERFLPLEPLELRLLGEFLAARGAVTIAISSWRSAHGLEDAAFAERYNGAVARTLEILLEMGWDTVARRFGAGVGALGGDVPDGALVGHGSRARAADDRLAERRARVLGPALEPLSYREPIRIERADGVWIHAADGRRYLDAYNNVPCVGHGHPRVTEAVARQLRQVNTNLRYLHEGAVVLAERLVASLPSGLDTVFFVNSGSEANDLAWRLATSATGGRGALCTAHAYHGISEAITAVSPESWRDLAAPDWVAAWDAPDPLRGTALDAGPFMAALAGLADRRIRPAATFLDGLLTSDGFPAAPPELVRAWLEATHAAGGLWVADEVQGGHGRTGEAMWSFERFGITPDIVTLGKPMGNGFPLGAVITRSDIAAAFAEGTVFFSTFGGNPVAAAAGNAVLDVLEDERVLARVTAVGEELRAALRQVAERHEAVGDVRGFGLAVGVELVIDRGTLAPDADLTAAVKEGMRDRGVLVGTSARAGNVLKIRPPLAFTSDEVARLAGALDGALEAVGR